MLQKKKSQFTLPNKNSQKKFIKLSFSANNFSSSYLQYTPVFIIEKGIR